VAKRRKPPAEVFLNIPYDRKFENLFLAYIAGISAFGLWPRATLEIPISSRRLDKIVSLVRKCRYSIHDLSRVESDLNPPRTPRFNMPFELGLAVAHQKGAGTGKHDWFVCEASRFRLAKSLSDLNGTDPFIHDGNIAGVFRELCNIFVRSETQPSMDQMWLIYREIRKNLPEVVRRSGATSLYTARVYRDLGYLANDLASTLVR
jgi:hypothetical protein